MVRYSAAAWVLAGVVLAATASAQIPTRDIGGGRARSSVSRPEAGSPSLEARKLRERAEKLRLQAMDLIGDADNLRDENKDDEAENLDERAARILERAKSFERRASLVEMTGGHPERARIPELP